MSQHFGEIYDQYVTKIYRFIFLKVESRETAEDLCSEVFVRCLDEFRKDADSIENIQAFLYQIARFAIADYYRGKASRKIVPVEEINTSMQEDSSLFEQAALAREIEEVRKAIRRLRDEYQNLIIWYYLDELSIAEIAQITGKSQGSVRIGIHRALASLKEQLPASLVEVPA